MYAGMARKVSKTVIVVVYIDIVNILKQITNPEHQNIFMQVHVLCFNLFVSDIEYLEYLQVLNILYVWYKTLQTTDFSP